MLSAIAQLLTSNEDGGGPVPDGERVTMLVGGSEEHPNDSLVVSGVIEGSRAGEAPERRGGRWHLDLLLGRLRTWRYQAPGPPVPRVWPEDFRAMLRVGVKDTTSLAETVELLLGDRDQTRLGHHRGHLSAHEIPWHRCPSCSHDVEDGDAYCRSCGAPVRVTANASPPATPPPSLEDRCPGCWSELNQDPDHCPVCGHELALTDACRRFVEEADRKVRFELVRDGRPSARMSATISWAGVYRIYERGDAQLTLEVTDVEFDGDRHAVDPHPPSDPSFGTRLVVAEGQGGKREILDRMLAGERVQASEYKRRCTACQAENPEGQAVHVLGRHCARCGSRERLIPHADWPGRRPDTASGVSLRHSCGTGLRWEDAHCTGCGASLQGFDPRPSRLSRL